VTGASFCTTNDAEHGEVDGRQTDMHSVQETCNLTR